MKEYTRPILNFIEFDERDVLVVSGVASFNPGWLNLDPYGNDGDNEPLA